MSSQVAAVEAGGVNKFSNLCLDAVPQPPRITIEDVNEENSDPPSSVPVRDTTPSSLPKKKTKFKIPFSINIGKPKKRDIFNSTKENFNPPSTSPIATQATGNVINVINSTRVHVGTSITNNVGSPIKEETSQSAEFNVKKTKSISAIMQSEDRVTHAYIEIVSRNIGSNWKSICRSMNMTDEIMDTLYLKHKDEGLTEVIYQIFLDWVRNEDARLGELASNLWTEGKRSLVKYMATYYKTEQIKNNVEGTTVK